MNKRMFGACLAVAAAITMGAVFVVQAQDAGITANDNSNANANVNVPPPPAPEPAANVNDNHVDQAPPAENVPPSENHDLLPPKSDNEPQHPPTTFVPPPEKPEPKSDATSSGEGKRVKIPSPEQIKFFQDIKKIGNSLFGIMKKNANMNGTTPSLENKSTEPTMTNGTTGEQQTEKILSPDMIKFYTAIKKIGTSLFGVRKDGTGPKNVAPKAHHIVTAEESACVIAAIKAKDQTVVDGKTAETTAFNAAVVARTDCQTAALGTTDGQAVALALCAKNFAAASGQARETFAKLQKDAWTKYVASLKSCVPTSGTTSGGTTNGGDIMIEDGNVAP